MTLRDILFRVHLVTGLTVGLVILIMSVTGAILAFRPQIIDFAEHDIYQSIPSEPHQTRLSLNDIKAKVKEFSPDAKLTGVLIKADPNAPMMINLGREKSVYINPYTGSVLGQGSGVRAWMEQVEIWHRWLGLQGSFKRLGHNIKGVCNIAFLIMIITGFYLWWPRNWRWKTLQASMQLNLFAKGKMRDWNWHNVIGFWCAPFLIIITLTGVVMSYQWANDLVYRVAGNEPPTVMNKERDNPSAQEKQQIDKQGPSDFKKIDFDKILEKSQNQVPGWTSINMRISRPGGPVNIFIEEKGSGYIHPRSQLTLNSATAELIKWEPASKQNLGRKLRTGARFLHTGEIAGIIGQTIAFLSALGAVMLVWTGLSLALQRFTAWRIKIQAKS